MAIIKKISIAVIMFLIGHAVPVLSRLIYNKINLAVIQNDTLQQLRYIIIVYGIQIFFTIALLIVLIRDKDLKYGFNLKNTGTSISILKKFVVIWTVIVALFFIIALSFIPGFGNYMQAVCPPRLSYLIKDFVGGVILAGIGEEPLYRSLVILTLSKYWNGNIKMRKFNIPHVTLISGFIFMTAHIGYIIYPYFQITHLDLLQLTFTFILGVFWANVFMKTKSLLCPILAHSSSNAIQYGIGYIVSFIVL